MMLKKHALFSIALLSSASLYAIPIESRGLSDTASSRNDVANSAAPIAGNMNWDLIQKNQQLENQIRELRGKIEEQDHAIDQLNKELTNRYTDLDQRLELLNQKLEPESNQPEQAPAENVPVDSSTATDQTATASKATTNSPAPTTAQNPATSANSSNNTSDPVALEKAAYTIALDAYKKGGAKQAIAPMQNFIKNYPNSIYTGNAYFWLAEFQLAIDPPNYNEAKKNYEIVAAKFPNSSKAPRALYQLYSIAKDVNKNTQTANVYKSKLLSTYPKSEEAGFFKKG
ncbi:MULTISPECIES: YbgF trimerization domain-containing protein [Acinetobacter]|uniref:YbgF trimerization domain-containing protein n=1 Tax=Acinetobacter TaxID=469 RepID=UPI0022E15983|nr:MULTISPECIES: YbgF trimerization domain-containing protein [Acinetobacter]MDI1225387.1 YbgF trimerization domain-containing protein [Acinetobacter sp.]